VTPVLGLGRRNAAAAEAAARRGTGAATVDEAMGLLLDRGPTVGRINPEGCPDPEARSLAGRCGADTGALCALVIVAARLR